MISLPKLEKEIKWNTTTDLQTEIYIESIRKENVSISQYMYNIVSNGHENKLICANDTLNLTDNCEDTTYDIFEITVVILLCLLIVVIIIGNTLIILAVVTTKRLRTITNCFVTNLAVADLLVGIFVMPPAIAVHISGKWELGWIFCDIWISLDILLCTASILSLCVISVDRYLAITWPLSYSKRRRSKKLAVIMIVIVWLVAAFITCPPILGWYEPNHNKDSICRYNQNAGYVVFSAIGSFFLPLAVMMYVYARISCVVARRHQQLGSSSTKYSKKEKLSCFRAESESGSDKLSLRQSTSKQTLRNSTQQSESSTQLNQKCPCCYQSEKRKRQMQGSCSTDAESRFHNDVTPKENIKYKNTIRRSHSMKEHTENNRVSSFRRETKTAKMLSLVVGGFIVCWFPFFLYYLLIPFISDTYKKTLLMYILTWLGWFNSAINPFIYAFVSPEFRVAFWRLTIKKIKRNKCCS